MRKAMESASKAPSDSQVKNYVSYGEIDVQVFAENSATIAGEVFITTEIDGQKIQNSLMQMISAKKENGKWLFCMISASPLTLTQEGIEAYPLTFADNVLASLKAELQTQTFDLMNESFSGGILCTYIKDKYPLCFANDSLIQLMGYTREEFEEKFKDDTVQMAYFDDKNYIREISEKGENSDNAFQSRLRWVKRDGNIIWVEARTRSTKDDYGKSIFLSVVMDVSEMVELQLKTQSQNDLILSGLNYSSNIQQNILPTKETLKRAFSDYAVIWKPRNIVGGDMYWVKNLEKGTVVCVSDCTGHGTSGALLTMLVSTTFDDYVKEDNCSDTAGIIWNLDQKLISVFSRKQNTSNFKNKDGCDLAVLFIAKDGSVMISSAHTHVYVCDGNEVMQIKGQHLFVGEGSIRSKEEIKVVHVPANSNNRFYVASDGLSDQPGGSNDRPYGYKELKEIILKYHKEEQSVISHKIWQAFEAWRGEEARVDDLELVSFKI